MPSWYFEKIVLKNTPSFKEGIESEKEARYRREGARFIMELGTNMGLRKDTMATGIVFFHRFYMIHSFTEFPRYVMATCCLFLAGKVEETPKKCKDIVKAAKTWLETKNLEKYWPNIEDPIKEIMTYERILLQSIKFDLQVDHPYSYLLKYAKTLKGDTESIRKMVQMAWTFINDSYCTTLCLQWEPEIIAIALMYLTSKLSRLEITDWITKKENSKQKWWEQFVEGLNVEILEDICHQVLDLYATQQHQSPGQQQQHTQTQSQQQNEQQKLNNKRKSPCKEPIQNQNQQSHQSHSQAIELSNKHFKLNETQYRQTLHTNSNNILLVNSTLNEVQHESQQQQPQQQLQAPLQLPMISPYSHQLVTPPATQYNTPIYTHALNSAVTCMQQPMSQNTYNYVTPNLYASNINANANNLNIPMNSPYQSNAMQLQKLPQPPPPQSSQKNVLPPPLMHANHYTTQQQQQIVPNMYQHIDTQQLQQQQHHQTGPPQPPPTQLQQPQQQIMSAYDSFYLNNSNLIDTQRKIVPTTQNRSSTLRMVDISGRKM